MAAEVRHVSFNPVILSITHPTVVGGVCEQEEKDGWTLLRVVPVHPYETIAVFTREGVDGGS